MKRDVFEKILRFTEEKLRHDQNLSLEKAASQAMDEQRIHVDERNGVIFSLERELRKKLGKDWKINREPLIEPATEEKREEPGMFSKEIMENIRKGAVEVEFRESVIDEIKKGGDPESEIGRKKFEALGFIPRR